VAHPGSDGAFIIVADGFTLAKGAPHRDECVAWLKTCGSKDAQEAFNPLKGSIPARTDADKSKFGPYHNWSMTAFASAQLVPSVVHGEAAPAGFQQALNDAITTFVVDKNVNNFTQALTQAAKDAEMAK
jgi:glucose/mannose transport system substrate-binding protein